MDLSSLGPPGAAKLLSGVALHPNGEAWISDSWNGIIYRVDFSKDQGTLFVQDERFLPQDEGGLGIVGLEYYRGDDDEDQYLIAGRYGLNEVDSGLFRVEVLTGEIRRIRTIDNGLDDISHIVGMDFDRASGDLWVSASKGQVYRFQSDDDWITASLVNVYTISSGEPYNIDYVHNDFEDAYVITNPRSEGPYTIERAIVKEIITASGADAPAAAFIVVLLSALLVFLL